MWGLTPARKTTALAGELHNAKADKAAMRGGSGRQQLSLPRVSVVQLAAGSRKAVLQDPVGASPCFKPVPLDQLLQAAPPLADVLLQHQDLSQAGAALSPFLKTVRSEQFQRIVDASKAVRVLQQ